MENYQRYLCEHYKVYTVNLAKDSGFVFAEKIVEQDSAFLGGNLDVDSLFTDIPLEEIIDICNSTNTFFLNLVTAYITSTKRFDNTLILQSATHIPLNALYI